MACDAASSVSPPISVTILTKNSQKYLREILEKLIPFPEVVIYDTGSSDDTLAIARQFSNVSLHCHPFVGFGPTHNLASASAKYDWILSIDSDEVPTSELIHELLNIPLDVSSVYAIPRHNYFNGKWIRWCGWHPEKVIRLYHRKSTQFSNHQVHEGIEIKGMKLVTLCGALIHYSYNSIADFLEKMQLYSELFAKQHVGKRSSSFSKALFHGFFAFFKSYLLKKGFLGGYEGFVISLYNGHTAYYKYLKLYEWNQKAACVQKKKQVP